MRAAPPPVPRPPAATGVAAFGLATADGSVTGGGAAPSSPQNVTSITRDSGARVSFYAPTSSGGGAITHYVVTPYLGATPQVATTVTVASLTNLTDSSGGTALQADVTGLTNGSAYTFTVKARNAFGDSAESTASGANTPLAGLVFGDDFNGPAGGPLDPEWFVYNRCGFLGQSEIQWYLPSQCVLDGSGNLALTGVHTSHTGTSYPSDGSRTVTQSWISGACQSNTRSFAPSADGNTMTFEARFQICPGIAGGMWPGLVWLEGTDYQQAWKTDPDQTVWNTTGKAEIDIAEFGSVGQTSPAKSTSTYITNLAGGSGFVPNGGVAYSTGIDFSAAMHVFSAAWKGTAVQATRSVKWYRDAPYVSGTGPSGGTLTTTLTDRSDIPTSANPFFMNLYLQIITGNATSPQTCLIDYIRIYDENLG